MSDIDPEAVEGVHTAGAMLLQTAYLVGVFYQALKDQGLPDGLIESLVRDWHYVAVSEAEWTEVVEED